MPTQYTRADAARLLKISISTLDRKIARGELETVTEPFGARERIFVLLEDPPPRLTTLVIPLETPLETPLRTLLPLT